MGAWVPDNVFVDFARRESFAADRARWLVQQQEAAAKQGRELTLHQLALEAKLLTDPQAAVLAALAARDASVPPAAPPRPAAPIPPPRPAAPIPPPRAVAPLPPARPGTDTEPLPPLAFDPIKPSDRHPKKTSDRAAPKKDSERSRPLVERRRYGQDRLANSHVSDDQDLGVDDRGRRKSSAALYLALGGIAVLCGLAAFVFAGGSGPSTDATARAPEPAPDKPVEAPRPADAPSKPTPPALERSSESSAGEKPAAAAPSESSPLRRAERSIAQSRALAPAEGRALLERILAEPDVASHPIASALLERELAQRASETPSPESEPAPSPSSEDPVAATGPRDRPEEPEAGARDEKGPLATARSAIRRLDLAAARAALDAADAESVKTERLEVDARAAWLDAAGAKLPRGLTIAVAGEARRVAVGRASAAGVELESGSKVPWAKVARGSRRELLLAADRADVEPLGAALVLHDQGLWRRADQRLKSIGDDARAVAIAARLRGETEVRWRSGEWLTADEEQSVAKDLVAWEGQSVPREEARKQVEKLRKDRKPSKKGVQEKLRARAEELRREYGVQDVRTIVSSGDPAKRADIVVISDGYAAEDVKRFETIAAGIAKAVLTIEPFKNYARYVNIHRVTVVESKSGVTGSTRIGSRVLPGGILVCKDETARQFARLAPDADLVIVNANVRGVRSTGTVGARPGVITQDSDGDFNDVVLHEIGHAFADLDDEYVDPSVAPSHPDYADEDERYHVNTTRQSNAGLAKWHYWRLPPFGPDEQRVDCFEGGYYRARGYWRPCKTCRMESRGGCTWYCPPCLEKLEKSFYERIEPIDDVSPRTPDVLAWKDEPVKLEATAIAIESAGEKLGSFSARWFLDGKVVPGRSSGIKTELEIPAGSLAPGLHTVAIRVLLKDTRVRRDDGLLSSVRAWTVRARAEPRPKLAAPDHVDAKRGELVAFDVSCDVAPKLAEAPEGASLEAGASPGKWRLVWAPPRRARGAFRAVLAVGDGRDRVERATTIAIQDDKDVPPVLADPGTVHAVRGQPLEVKLEATDADGDALVFSADPKKLPPGATLDGATGVLRWTPSFSFPYEPEVAIPVRATDGKKDDELVLKVKVENRAIDGPGPGFDLLVAARSPVASVRAASIEALARCDDLPVDAVLLDLARLVRDPEPEIVGRALEALRRLPARGGGRDESAAWSTRRSLLAIDFADHVWELSDKPAVRAFVRELAKGDFADEEGRRAAETIRKDLSAVESYNRDRGVR